MILKIHGRQPQQHFVTRPNLPKSHGPECRAALPGPLPKLRPGLPVQMIEVHDPVRLLIVVEHFPAVVLKTIQSDPVMYEWFINEWVHLVAADPATHTFLYFKDGAFVPYVPLTSEIAVVQDFHTLVETATEMETNQIADATQENLPVFVLNTP